MIGIIGGSGIYQMEGFTQSEQVRLSTPFGEPSDSLVRGTIKGVEVVFLPRHGSCHTYMPGQINYRANIYALKQIGVRKIISVSSVGSFKEEIAPKDIVLPDQFIDRTNQRVSSFFGSGCVAHISFADPICKHLVEALYQAGKELEATVHKGGTYLNMEGPAFSTKAESKLYKSWGADIIGMTNMTEARLAREAEMCYATVALVTDYDSWHPEHDSVTTEMIIQNFQANVGTAQKLLQKVIPLLADSLKEAPCACENALKSALITRIENIPEKKKEELKFLIKKYS